MPDDFDYSLPHKNRAKADQPIITMLLVVLSVAFTAAYWYSNANPRSPMSGISDLGVVSPFDIWHGKYYGLVLSMFPHGNIAHIVFNMMWTWRLGAAIETELHPLAYLAFIVAAAVFGTCTELCITGHAGIGMSGVVYAMFGLMWAARGSYGGWRNIATKENLNLFIGWGVLCIITTYFHVMNVANGAHFGGLVFGLCVGYLWYAPRRRPIFWLPMALLGVISVLSLNWLPWTGTWQIDRGVRDVKSGNYVSAIHHIGLALRLFGGPDKQLVRSWDALETAARSNNPIIRKQAEEEITTIAKDVSGPKPKGREASKSNDNAAGDEVSAPDSGGTGQ